MIRIIKTILLLIINDIDSGNSNMSEAEQLQVIDLLLKINRKELSSTEAADFIGVSKSTLNNYVKKGILPEGTKRSGITEKLWNKSDLIKFLNNK